MKKLLLLIALVLLLPAPLLAEANRGAVLAAPGGRFVFGQVSEMARDQFLLDTATGRLWQIVTGKKGEMFLTPVPFQLGGGGITLNAPTQEEDWADVKKTAAKFPPITPR